MSVMHNSQKLKMQGRQLRYGRANCLLTDVCVQLAHGIAKHTTTDNVLSLDDDYMMQYDILAITQKRQLKRRGMRPT